MASMIRRGKKYAIVYMSEGKQMWESCASEAEAKKRKLEIEYKQGSGTFVPPNPMTVEDFMKEFVDVYGVTKWSHSTYANNTSLIRNYIVPLIGAWKLKDITTKKMDAFFTKLKTQPAALKRFSQKARKSYG